MHLHQLGNIKSGSTQDLDLPYVHTLQRVDAAALLLNVLTCRHTPLLNACGHCHTMCAEPGLHQLTPAFLCTTCLMSCNQQGQQQSCQTLTMQTQCRMSCAMQLVSRCRIVGHGCTVEWHTNGLRDELANQLLEVTAASFPGHDLCHLLADLTDLTALGIACALHLLNHTQLQPVLQSLSVATHDLAWHMLKTWLCAKPSGGLVHIAQPNVLQFCLQLLTSNLLRVLMKIAQAAVWVSHAQHLTATWQSNTYVLDWRQIACSSGSSFAGWLRSRSAAHFVLPFCVDHVKCIYMQCNFYLASPLLGETNAEHAQHVAVCGLDLHMSLNQSLPLAYQTTQFVCGEVHALYRIIKLASAYSPILQPSCCCCSFQPLYF